MELSLILHPAPSENRFKDYASAIKGRPLQWNQFVTLDAIANRSTSHSDDLRREALELLKGNRPIFDIRMNRLNGVATASEGSLNRPKGAKETRPASVSRLATPPDLSNFEPITRTIFTVRNVRSVANTAMAGSLTINIRPAVTSKEKELLTRSGGSSPQISLPLCAAPEGPNLEGIQMTGLL